ncbi:MAG TPA: hypothetical protein VGX23_37850 [Actinocrinis sp.]|nr:hypothetical protein [Actinocrinis sp.]
MFTKSAAAAAPASVTSVRRLSAVAVLGLTLAASTACASQAPAAATKPAAAAGAGVTTGASASATPAAATTATPAAAPLTYTAGMALVSDGTATVKVGTQTVTFPTTVTDAAWSPDGSRIAFVDAQGNIATAHPDGSGLIVLTKTDQSVTRSNPTWDGSFVVFAQTDSKGFGTLEGASAPSVPGAAPAVFQMMAGNDKGGNPITNNTDPSAQADPQAVMGGSFDLAFQHAGSDGPEVWVVDYNQRDSESQELTAGAHPAISPDGSEVAYVNAQGQIEVSEGNGGPVQITFGATDPTHLVWSPDGTKLAYSEPHGVYSVATKPAGSHTNPATQLSATSGTATFHGPDLPAQVGLFNSTDPVALSVAASQDRWPTESGFGVAQVHAPATEAVIGNGTDLSTDAALLPQGLTGPLLLTDGPSLDPRVTAELKRVFGTVTSEKPTVYLLGSTTQLTPAVADGLTAMGYQVQRVIGPSTEPPVFADQAPIVTENTYPKYDVNRLRTFVAVDQNNPLDNLLGTAFAESYYAPVVQVGDGDSALPTSVAAWIAQTTGAAVPAVVFVPASGGTSIANAIGGFQQTPFGFRLALAPADPVKR